MAETLWDSITEFLSPEAGQRRRAALDEFGRDVGYYVPPEMRGLLGFAAEMTPTATLERAGQASQRMFDADRTATERVGDLGAMLSETAGVVAPMMVAPRAGMTAAQAVQEGLLGASVAADDVGRRFVDRMNQPGPVPTMYSNPLMGGGMSDPTQTGWTFRDVSKPITTKADNRRISGDTSRIEEVPINRLYATQPTVNTDFATTSSSAGEMPLVVRKGGKMFVQDGHHRLTKQAEGGAQTAAVRFIDLDNADTSTPLLDWSPEKTGFVEADQDLLDELFAPSFPAPRNDAEAMARDILEMRAAGRAGDVTDEMMAQADPQYMFANTPLPMDEASRMARRDAMYGKDRFHGSNMDFQGFSGNVFTSDNPTVASTYNRGMLDAQIYPVVTREGPMGTVAVEGGLSNWNQLLPEMIDDPVIARELDRGMPISTRDIERQAAFEGRSGVTFKDINDLGPGFNSQKFKGIGYSPEESEKLRREYLEELSVPSEVDVRLSPNLVRSRFARFDPEFRHLRNLSAGVAGGGLLAAQDEQQQREDEIRQYLGGLL